MSTYPVLIAVSTLSIVLYFSVTQSNNPNASLSQKPESSVQTNEKESISSSHHEKASSTLFKQAQTHTENDASTATLSDAILSTGLIASRKKMLSTGLRFLDESSDLYQHFKRLYEDEPFKLKVINNGADIIRARIHPKGNLVISHSTAETLQQVATDKDTYLETISTEMHGLNRDSNTAAHHHDYITKMLFPLAEQFAVSLYNFSCSDLQCILLANYQERNALFSFISEIEKQDKYIRAWSYPIRHTDTEVIYLQF
ncbi:hypothetical protein [Alteromonas sp. a30]|uniref:hypothetical protein n=1 Tax=Alteromonas sp. a30 TaxID=2730917 RepID=UPI002281CD5D|nr:hypothetical protein [Alteromonas sp. a30]MCY7295685.1 hypothetical protein [Alteromonas sp. a30]